MNLELVHSNITFLTTFIQFTLSIFIKSADIISCFFILQDACRYFLIESGFALFVAFLINVSIVSVSGTVCWAKNLSPEDAEQCGDLTLKGASFLLKVQVIIAEYLLMHTELTLIITSEGSTIAECAGKVEFDRLFHCVISFGTKLYNNRHLCWTIHHAGS